MPRTHRYFGAGDADTIDQFTLEVFYDNGELERPALHHSIVIWGREGDDRIGFKNSGYQTRDDSWAVVLRGGAGNDVLSVGQGHKALGGSGNDHFSFFGTGDLDKKTIAKGGDGADRFLFESVLTSREAVTIIQDFDPIEDQIGIEGQHNNLKNENWTLNHMRQKHDDSVIRYNTDSDNDSVRIVLRNVDLDDLTADAFYTISEFG